MAIATRVDTVSLAYLLDLFGPAWGVELLRRGGYIGDGGEPPATIAKIDLWQLCVDSINCTNDEGHGALARPLPKSSWGMVFSSVDQMPTLGEGIKRFTELVPVLQCGIVASLGYSAGGAHLTLAGDESLAGNRRSERYLDLFATCFLSILICGVEEEFRPYRVRLSSLLDPEDGYMLSGLAQSLVRSGSGTTISIRLADLDIPLVANRFQSWGVEEIATFRRVQSSLSSPPWRDESATVSDVLRLLKARSLSQPEVARALGLSVATLQRRLAQSETSFRDLSRSVRREQLATLLASDARLDDIAEKMGFSDRRSLTRASRDWLGVTPSKYRQLYKDQGGLIAALAGVSRDRAHRTG